jgi:cytochrome P450
MTSTSVQKTIPAIAAPVGDLSKLVRSVGAAFERCGDVVRLEGPAPVFFFRHPEHIKAVYNNPETAITKPAFSLSRVKHVMGNGTFAALDKPAWGERSRAVGALFSRTHSQNLIVELAPALEDMFERANRSGPRIDLLSECKLLIVDFAFRQFFSSRLDPSGLIRIAGMAHSLVDSFLDENGLWLPTPRNLRFKYKAAQLRSDFRRLVAGRANLQPSADDILTKLLLLKSEASLGWSDEDVVDEMASLFFGMSNLAAAVAWILYSLAEHPGIQKDLRQSLTAEQNRTAEEPQQGPLLAAVINESLRLRPPAWGYPRIAAARTAFDGMEFAAGSVLFPLGYYAHRHPSFWSEPEQFDPQRFLTMADGALHRYAFYPFGGGPRACLGRHLAAQAVPQIISAAVTRWDLGLISGRESPEQVFGFELLPSCGLPVEARVL